MYGAKYIGRYKALLYLWYKEGSSNSEMKVGPSIMEKRLWEMYPGIYTKPSFTEIQSFVSQLFSKEKKNEDTLPVDVFGADDDDDIIDDDEIKLVKKALEVMDLYCGLIMPQSVLYHLEIYGEDVETHKEAIKKAVRKVEVNGQIKVNDANWIRKVIILLWKYALFVSTRVKAPA
jgi:hypothetical protein